MSCKPKQSYLDTHNVIVTTSSVAKALVVSTIFTQVSSQKLSASYVISTGLSDDVSEPSRKSCREDDASLPASHHKLMIAFEEFLKTCSSKST